MSAPRTAVVTGVARRHAIGRACSHAFLQAGYRVVGVDKSELEQLDDPVLQLHKDSFKFKQADITDHASVQRLADEIHAEWGPVDALINNAGIAAWALPECDASARRRDWHRILATNLTGAFLMTEAIAPRMAPGKSAIVHVSSVRALQSEPNAEAYAASKAGLLGLGHAQAMTLQHRVRVNVVVPGWINVSGDAQSFGLEDHDWHPVGRVGEPADIAMMCVFLADPDRAGFITGQHFVVDGGVTKKLVYPEDNGAFRVG